MKTFGPLLVAVALSTQHAPAQDAANTPQNQSAQQYKFTARSNLVFLPTQVRNRKGETIYGLKPEQFIVEDNGVRQTVKIEQDPDVVGLSMVVAIQCSRYGAGEFRKFEGLAPLIEQIAGDGPHEVAVVSYGEEPYLLGGFSGSPEALQRALSKLQPCGGVRATTIDVVSYAIGMLKRRPGNHRRVILVIGEKRDHGSRAKVHDVVMELGISDTVVFTMAFSAARDQVLRFLREGNTGENEERHPVKPPAQPPDSSSAPAQEEPVYKPHRPPLTLPPELIAAINALHRNTASEIASLSGGEYLNFTSRKSFEDALQRVGNHVHDYYLLSFQPPSNTAFGLHTLRVKIPDYPDAVIQTRKSYWAGMPEDHASEGR